MMDLAASGKKAYQRYRLGANKVDAQPLIDNPAVKLITYRNRQGRMVCMNKDGRVESEIYFNYMGGGLNIGCKSKIDYIQFFSDKYDDTDVNLIDLKPHKASHFKSSYKYKFGYYRQAAFYRLTALSQGLNVKIFTLLQLKHNTHTNVQCLELVNGIWKEALMMYDLLVSLNTCIEEDHFPMYGHQVMTEL